MISFRNRSGSASRRARQVSPIPTASSRLANQLRQARRSGAGSERRLGWGNKSRRERRRSCASNVRLRQAIRNRKPDARKGSCSWRGLFTWAACRLDDWPRELQRYRPPPMPENYPAPRGVAIPLFRHHHHPATALARWCAEPGRPQGTTDPEPWTRAYRNPCSGSAKR